MKTGVPILPLLMLLAACPKAAVSPTTTLSVAGGRVTLTGHLGTKSFVIRDASIGVRVDGTRLSTASATCGSGMPLHCDLGQGLTLTFTSEPGNGGLLLTASVAGTGSHRVDGFELLNDAEMIPSGGTPSKLRYLHNGYQSWSFSGVLDIPAGTLLPRTDDVINYPAPNGSASIAETLGLSSHSAIISGGDGSALALGFVSTRLWQGAIAMEAPSHTFQLTAQCGFTGDSVPLAESPVQSETLFVKYDVSPEAAMGSYGDVLAGFQSSRATPPTTPQRGWFSWNRYFDQIDQPTMLAQAAALPTVAGSGDFNLIEIDDGWENAWGDWTPNGKFDAIDTLAAARHAAGQKLGLWVAPFVVEQSESVVAAHPDWWVKDTSGRPLVHSPPATAHQLMIVDTTQPDALAWAVANLSALQTKGVDFFKLDYLYAAALDGERADPNATGVTALKQGLDAVLNGIGPASVNLCGVPWLHAALASPVTIRTGADVAYGVGASGFALVGAAARNMVARAFGPLGARADPDQFWLFPLTAAEQRTALALQTIAAESFSLADDLTTMTPDELAAVKAAAGVSVDRGATLEPRGLLDSAGNSVTQALVEVLNGPDAVQTALPSVLVRGDLLVATNWGTTSAAIDLHLQRGETVTSIQGPGANSGKVMLAPHDTALFQLHPAER